MNGTTTRAMDSVFAESVRAGLNGQPKTLSSKYFYDELGSQLFEAICYLPEYYLTRTERGILERDAPEMVAPLDPDVRLVELGAGSAIKTRILIRAMLGHQPTLTYCPIDISDEAMRIAQANIVSEFPTVTFKAVIGDWLDSLGRLSAMDATQKLIAFLGSSIGNLTNEDATAFLARLRKETNPADKLLLGTDLVKSPEVLLPAYDDAAGVTAAFNKNLLLRINQELGGHFDLQQFRHEARWNADRKCVEAHLISLRPQTVVIDAIEQSIHFDEGESIHTENSHKYTMEDVHTMATSSGWYVERSWTDPDKAFALHILGHEV